MTWTYRQPIAGMLAASHWPNLQPWCPPNISHAIQCSPMILHTFDHFCPATVWWHLKCCRIGKGRIPWRGEFSKGSPHITCATCQMKRLQRQVPSLSFNGEPCCKKPNPYSSSKRIYPDAVLQVTYSILTSIYQNIVGKQRPKIGHDNVLISKPGASHTDVKFVVLPMVIS